jgi:valyl-tRNA synthetase
MKSIFEPKIVEKKWYAFWESNDLFAPDEDSTKEPFCIMIPPPNVTGSLHMGHGFQNTLMDTLARYKRLKGFEVLWQVGTDHAGIATQIVVERNLEKKGITKESLGRENFEKEIWKWKEESGSTITKQLRRLGASLDWKNEKFTMDDDFSDAVSEVFCSLYEEGLIYQGYRLVNWDYSLQTALSDLEVISSEESGKLWEISYPTDIGDLTIATTRPETMLGDVALAVNPNDKRYKKYIGKEATIPLALRKIPIIGDDYVDMEFGTGCLKITPGHDFNDFEIGKRNNLPVINILNKDGTLNENSPKKYQGILVTSARKEILKDLEKLGNIINEKGHK